MIVTLEEMKQYLRVDFDDDDSLIETLITSATRLCMDITRQNEDVFEGSENAKPTCFREAITSPQMAVSITRSTRSILNSTVIARTRHWKQHWKLCLMSTAFFITKQRSGLRARSSMKSSTHLKWRFNQHG